MCICVCVGEYAANPYYVPGLELAVYSAEELCFCLRENAFLLDGTLMRDELVEWIDRECGLKELASQLYPLIHRRGSLSAFVTAIMQYVGFYDQEEIGEIEQVLKQGAGLSAIEKRKGRIDQLVRKKRYAVAIRGYDNLLANWGEMEREGKELPAATVRASILHNKAVALAGMMLYGFSAEVFLKAYETDGDAEHYMAYLSAKRMELEESDYIRFVSERVGNYEYTLALEKRLEGLDLEWKLQPEYQRLEERKEWRVTDRQRYYDENDVLTQTLKDSYCSIVNE